MAVRSTLATIIDRVRTLINDPRGASQTFADQDIQNCLDDYRQDVGNVALTSYLTYVSGTVQYLDYYHDLGSWEDGFVLKQFLTVVVTPSASEPIVGHWTFATSTRPPVYLTGSTHDIYRAAADLLERWAAKWALNYDFSSDGQSFRRSQAASMLQALAVTYRKKQRASNMSFTRSDLQSADVSSVGLGAKPIDYMSSG
jgi:hypothetical protein